MGSHTEPDDLLRACKSLREAKQPFEALEASLRLRVMAEQHELEQVRTARQSGVSWVKIGALYGLTKQGAQQRFAKLRKSEG